MTMIQFSSITLNADGTWTFAWPDQGASFYRVVLWGKELANSPDLNYTWRGQEYAAFPPPLEIANGNTPVPSEQYLPFLVIQWYGEACAYYLVQRFDVLSSAWVTVSRISEGGQWLYSFTTPTLTDETTYQYRVVAVDSLGNQATPRAYTRYVVCPPVPPDGQVQASYVKPNAVIASV